MTKSQIHLLLKQTMEQYGIRGKDLAAVAGVGAVHISEVRAGRRWVSPEVFVAILEGMDQIAPGSRRYFCQLLGGDQISSSSSTIGEKIAELIEIADDNDIEMALLAISRRWKQVSKSEQNVTQSKEKGAEAIAQSAVLQRAIAV